jgi:hypothetical protein
MNNNLTVDESSLLVCFQFLSRFSSYFHEISPEIKELLQIYESLKNEENIFSMKPFLKFQDRFCHPVNILKEMNFQQINFRSPRVGEIFVKGVNCEMNLGALLLISEFKNAQSKMVLFAVIFQDYYGYFQFADKERKYWNISENSFLNKLSVVRLEGFSELVVYSNKMNYSPKVLFFNVVK